MLRLDLRVYPGDQDSFSNENDMRAAVKAVLSSAIIKGLDIVGIASNMGPQLGLMAQQITRQENLDLFVLPCEDYVAADKIHLLIYNLKQPMQPQMTGEQAISMAHQQGGWVMLVQPTHRQAQWLNKAVGTDKAPDGVEIYNAVSGGYHDLHLHQQYSCFITSSSSNAHELELSKAYTLMERDELEAMGLLPEGYLDDYKPRYLQNPEQGGNIS